MPVSLELIVWQTLSCFCTVSLFTSTRWLFYCVYRGVHGCLVAAFSGRGLYLVNWFCRGDLRQFAERAFKFSRETLPWLKCWASLTLVSFAVLCTVCARVLSSSQSLDMSSGAVSGRSPSARFLPPAVPGVLLRVWGSSPLFLCLDFLCCSSVVLLPRTLTCFPRTCVGLVFLKLY